MKTIYIYTLSDPISNDIRYVGKTVNPTKRYRKHLKESSRRGYHSSCWINSLLTNGVEPIITVIEICDDSNWDEREKYWIELYSKQYDLTNIHEGGGFGGTSYGFKGKKHSKESIDKMKEARIGVSIKQTDKNGKRKEALRKFFDNTKKAIIQYDLDDNFIREWDSAVDAANELNLIHSNITKACKGLRNKCGNFKWKYKL
jgi:group I intron endonuclease